MRTADVGVEDVYVPVRENVEAIVLRPVHAANHGSFVD